MENVISLSAEKIKRITPDEWIKNFEYAAREVAVQKKSLRINLISQGYNDKAINTSDDGANLYGTFMSIEALKEYGVEESFINEIKQIGHPHPDDTVFAIYVWADNEEQAKERLGEYCELGFTGEVNEKGLIYCSLAGEYI